MIAARETLKDTAGRYNAERRANERDLTIPDVADPVRRRQLEADDAAWLAHYLPDVFYNSFVDDQLEMIADVGHALRYGVKKAKAAERGGGKSSILKWLMVKYALQRLVKFPVVIAATGPKADKTTKSVRRRLASKQMTSAEIKAMSDRGGSTKGILPNLLCEDYPLECMVARHVDPWPSRARNVTANGQRPIGVEWGTAGGYFILPTWEDEEPIGPIVMAIGWSSDELQGCNIYDRRPDCIMLDDLDSRDSLAASDGLVAGKIETAIESTIAGLGGPDAMLGQYFLGTCASTEAAIYIFTDPQLKPAWDGKRVPAVKSWPTDSAMWEKYIHLRQKGMQTGDVHGREAHRFYLDNRDAMEAGSVVSNPHRFKDTELPDGSRAEVSNLQFNFNYIADNSKDAHDTEYQQRPPQKEAFLQAKMTNYHVAACTTDYRRGEVDPETAMIVRGVDVRKIELHSAELSVEPDVHHRITDYNIDVHGSSETTVEQAEELILDALRKLADRWEEKPTVDQEGNSHRSDITLIDKGWVGSWTEDGTVKTWAGQPVETFCIERNGGNVINLREFIPCKGAPNYRSPAPAFDKYGRPKVHLGDNWHINRGPGQERQCDEVIWNATHYHLLVEELFMLDEKDQDKFALFDPEPEADLYVNHTAFGRHMVTGAKELKAMLAKGTRSRKPRFVKDHWWDALAQTLVAKSIEGFFREKVRKRKPRRPLSEMAKRATR